MTQKRKGQSETRRPKRTGERLLPGDPTREELVARMIRVDQAGEYGAKRIYEGQLAVLENWPARGRRGAPRVGPALAAVREMAAQEEEHLEAFDTLMVARRVRPTLLSPLWHMTGFALGAVTAFMGERTAMACTVAIEETIDEHYAAQAEELGDDESELREMIETFRAHEIEHRDTALTHEAEQAPGYEVLQAAIKTGSRLAIWLSTRF